MRFGKLAASFYRKILKSTKRTTDDAESPMSVYRVKKNNPIANPAKQNRESIFENIECFSSDMHLKSMRSVNKKILTKKPAIVSLSNIPTSNSKRFDVSHEGVNIECYSVISKEKALYVFLSGAGRKGDSKTRFDRVSWAGVFEGNCLFIEDPMYKMYPNIDVGWYYGTEDTCFLDYCVEIIKRFADFRSIDKDNIYMIGSSCAGYAAIYIAEKISGSTAVALNPQIVPAVWDVNKRFENATGVSLEDYDKFGRNNISDLFRSNDSRFIIVSNILSARDYVKQLGPVFDKFDVNPNYGLTVINNTYIVLAKLPHPFDHGAFPGAMETNLLISLLNKGAGNESIVPYVEILQSNFSSNTRLNYTILWADFLNNIFQDFIVLPVYCDKANCILRVRGFEHAYYYQAHIDWTKKKCVVGVHLLEAFDTTQVSKIYNKLVSDFNFKFKEAKQKSVIYHDRREYEGLAGDMIEFIDKVDNLISSSLSTF